MHQVDIYHRHFIDNDDIGFQRIVLVPLKMHRSRPALFILLRHSRQL